MKNSIMQGLIPSFILLFSFSHLFCQSSPWSWQTKANNQDEVNILLMGDMNIQNRQDPASGFQHLLPTLKEADIRFCNLEGPFAGTSPDPKIGDIPHKSSWKHSNPEMVKGLVAAGFDVVGVANNVTFPYTSLQKSLQVLDEAGIAHTGGGNNLAEAHRPVIIERKGTKIGFLQYACTVFPYQHAAGVNQPGIARVKVATTYEAPPNLDKPAQPPLVHGTPDAASLRRMQQDIRELKAEADIVVASYHWGISNTYEPVEHQRQISRAAIEAGADIVFGHGPHKLQNIETWQNRPIFYSVGNAVFDWWKGRKSPNGLLVRLVAKNRRLHEISFVPLQRNEDNNPVLFDPAGEKGKKILNKVFANRSPARARLRVEGSEVMVFDADFQEKVPQLENLWKTNGLASPECAVYDPRHQVFYISNINGGSAGSDLDGDGFLSKVSREGKIEKLDWVTGLNDPKGMDIQGNFLYVNDKHFIVKIDVNTAKIVERHRPPGVVFLNDLVVTPSGTVFSNDADGHTIYQLKDGQIDVFWRDLSSGRPNGLWNEDDRLLIATTISKQLLALDKRSGIATVLQEDIGHGDGIEAVGNGGYLVTDFQGRIHYFSPLENLHTLLDIRGKCHTADLEYVAEEQLLVVPSHKYNTLQAFKLVWPEGME